MTHNVKFKVSLSNGDTLYEGKGSLASIAGELSPWNRLQARLSGESLTITSLSLYTDAGRTFNLPSAGRSPKFHAFHSAPKPTRYRCFRALAQDVNDTAEDHFTVAEADYGSHRLQIWVDENHPENSWVNLVPTEEVSP